MAADKQVQVKITGDSTNLFSSLQQSTAGIKTFAQDIKSEMSGISGTIGNLTAPFAALKSSFGMVTGAIAAVSAAIIGAIAQTNEFNASVNKLHLTLGVSLATATTWAIAAKEMGISIDDLSGIAAKLETRILKNSDTFTKWGVATKDAQGHALTGAQVLENLAAKYSSLGTQQERNALLASTMGKSWVESQKLMSDLSEKLEHGKRVQEDFNLTVTGDGVAASKAYKVATEDVGFAFQGVAKTVGDSVTPIITSLMKSFVEFAKEVLPGVSWAVKALTDGIAAVINIFNDLGIYAAETFDEIIDGFNLVSGVINKILDGDFKGAFQAAKDGYKAMADDHEAYAGQITASDEKYQARHRQIWSDIKKDEEAPAGKAGNTPGGLGDSESLMEKLKQRLEALRKSRAAELGVDADYFQLSKADEFAFWSGQLKTSAATGKDRIALENEVNSARKASKDEHFGQEKAALAAQLADLKGNFDAQIALAEANLASIGHIEGVKSSHYAEAAKQVTDLKNKQVDQTLKVNEVILNAEKAHVDAMDALDLQDLNFRKAQGEISETEFLQQQAAANNRKYQEDAQALAKRRELVAADPIETAKVNAEIQKLEDQRVASERRTQQELGALTGTAGSGFLAGLHKAVNQLPTVYQQFAAFGASIHATMTNSLGKAFDDMIIKGTSWKNAMVNATRAVATSVVSSFSQMAAKYLVDMAIKKGMDTFDTITATKKKADAAAAVAGESAKTLATTTGAATTTAAMTDIVAATDLATASMTDYAATSIWAAYADIPFGGEALALAEISSMEGSLAAVKAMAFAKGGVIDRPTLALMGEAGQREFVAPERDFKNVIKDVINSVMATTASVQAYAAQSFSGGSSGMATAGGSGAPNITINTGHILGSSADSANVIGKYLSQVMVDFNRRNG